MPDNIDLNLNVTATDGGAGSLLHSVGLRAQEMGPATSSASDGVQQLESSFRGIASGGLREFSQGLAGSVGLMPGLTVQSFAMRNAIMALGTEAGVAGLALGAGLGLGKALLEAGEAAGKFDYDMTIVRNNTTMTDQTFQGMVKTVKDLSVQTGSATSQIADGFRHAANLGYDYADSLKIVSAGNELATATGADVGETTNRIAGVMKEFGIAANDAGKAENTMFQIAATGNLTLQQLADYSGKLFAETGALKGSLVDVGTAYATLTQHGLDAAQSQTQMMGIMKAIIDPTKATSKELAILSQITGIDLVSDFSQAGLAAKGLNGIFDDLRRAVGGNTDEVFKLFNAQRGGLGAMTLLTTGTADWKDKLNDAADTMSGKATPATEALRREQDTLTAAHARQGQAVQALQRDVGEALTPVLKGLTNVVTDVIRQMDAGVTAAGKLDVSFKDVGTSALSAANGESSQANTLIAVIDNSLKAIPVIGGLAQAFHGLAVAMGEAQQAKANAAISDNGLGLPGENATSKTSLESSIAGMSPHGAGNPEVAANLKAEKAAAEDLNKQLTQGAKDESNLILQLGKINLDTMGSIAEAGAKAVAEGASAAQVELVKGKVFAEGQVKSLKAQIDTAMKESGGNTTPIIKELTDSLIYQEKVIGDNTAALEKHGKGAGGAGAAMQGMKNDARDAGEAITDQTTAIKIASDAITLKYLPALDSLNHAMVPLTKEGRGLQSQIHEVTLEMHEHAEKLKAEFEPRIEALKLKIADLSSAHKVNTDAVKAAKDQQAHLNDAYSKAKDKLASEYNPQLDTLRDKLELVRDKQEVLKDKIDDTKDAQQQETDKLKEDTIPTLDQLVAKKVILKDALVDIQDKIQKGQKPAWDDLAKMIGPSGAAGDILALAKDLNIDLAPALQNIVTKGLDPLKVAANNATAALDAIPTVINVDINVNTHGMPGGPGGPSAGMEGSTSNVGTFTGPIHPDMNPSDPKKWRDPVTGQPTDQPSGGNGPNILHTPTADDGGIFRGPGVVKIGNIDEAVFRPMSGRGANNNGGQVVVNINAPVYGISHFRELVMEATTILGRTGRLSGIGIVADSVLTR